MGRIFNSKTLAIILILIAFGFTTYRFHKRMPGRGYCDFNLWYTTGNRVLNQENIYILKDQTAAEFRYPPPAAAMMFPFALLDKHSAGILWHILSFWLLILSFILTTRIVIDKPMSAGKMFLFYFILTALLSRIIPYNFDEGQANIPMLFLALCSVYFAQKKKDVFSGIFLGASGVIKYMSALIWPYFLIKRRFKIAIISAICAIILILVCLPLVGYNGISGAISYIKEMFPYMQQSSFAGKVPFYMDYKNLGFLRLMYMYFTFTTYGIHFFALSKIVINIIIAAIIAILYLFVFWRPKLSSLSEKRLEAVDFGFLFLFMCYFNPNAWLHAYIFLLVPYAVVIYYLIERRCRDYLVLVCVLFSYILISLTSRSTLGDELAYQASVKCLAAAGVLLLLASLIKIKLNKSFLSTK